MLDEMALHPVSRCTAVSMLHCIVTAVSQGHQQIMCSSATGCCILSLAACMGHGAMGLQQ